MVKIIDNSRLTSKNDNNVYEKWQSKVKKTFLKAKKERGERESERESIITFLHTHLHGKCINVN